MTAITFKLFRHRPTHILSIKGDNFPEQARAIHESLIKFGVKKVSFEEFVGTDDEETVLSIVSGDGVTVISLVTGTVEELNNLKRLLVE